MTTERVATRVSDAEMTRRWDAVRKLMTERGIQALVAYAPRTGSAAMRAGSPTFRPTTATAGRWCSMPTT